MPTINVVPPVTTPTIQIV